MSDRPASPGLPDEPAPTRRGPQDLFAEFVDRIESGETLDFEVWVACQGEYRDRLRRIHRSWQAMQTAFASLTGDGARRTAAESESLSALMAKANGDGTRWDRYSLGPELARGAMGKIHRAWDQELRRDVAIKLAHDHGDARARRRFVEEAQIAAQLDHPGVVPIHELGLDPQGKPYFAMRLVRGNTLAEVLGFVRDGKPEWNRTRALHAILRVCEVLAYAHHKGVVHRDLKPANVMVGPFGEVYVMDWGLARVLGAGAEPTELATVRAEIEREAADSPLLTRDGDVVGTPAYMAPEQAAGEAGRTTPSADVYSLGAMLYHLLAGKPPYQTRTGTSADEALRLLRQGPPEPLPSDVPPELRAICERAMSRRAEDRYPSVVGLADDLRAFLELRVVSAYASGGFAELRKWVARNRVVTSLAAALVVALAVGVAVTANLWLDAEGSRRAADRSAERLATELENSRFRTARQALLLDNTGNGSETLWRQHLDGKLPRSTHWALHELAVREPESAGRRLPALEAVFSPAASAVLVAGRDGKLHVLSDLDLSTRMTLGEGSSPLRCVVAAPDLPTALVGDDDGNLTMWDIAAGTLLRRSEGVHRGAVEAVAQSVDGTRLASVGADGGICLWPAHGQPRRVADKGERLIAATFAQDGRLACTGEEGTVVVFDKDGSLLWDLRYGSRQMTAVAFVDDQLWVGTNGHEIHAIDLQDGKLVKTVKTKNGTVRDLAVAADGSVLSSGWWRIDRYRGLDDTTPEVVRLMSHKLDLAADGRHIALTRDDDRVVLLDISGGDLKTVAADPFGQAMSGDGKLVATSLPEGNALINAATGEVRSLTPDAPKGGLTLDYEGRYAAVMNRPRMTTTIVSLPDWKPLFEVRGFVEMAFPRIAAFSPKGGEVAVVGADVIRRHELPSGRLLAEYPAPNPRILQLVYSPDGNHLGAVWRNSQQSIRVIDVRTGIPTDHKFDELREGPQAHNVSTLAIDTDAQRIAVGAWSGRIAVRDFASGTTRVVSSHAGTVWDLDFATHDRGLLISSSGSGGITFWDLDTYEVCYQDQRLAGPLSYVALSPDGRMMLCRTLDAAMLVNLAYRDRHVASMLDPWLELTSAEGMPKTARVLELQAWAERARAEPPFRWGK